MTAIIGHLFLISRNYNQDYRLVYAPSFFQSSELAGILIDATGNSDETGDHNILTTDLDLHSSALPSRLFYRVIPAKSSDIGDASAGKITDNVGRTIYHIEGILIDKNVEFLASSIDGDSFSRLVHGPLMIHYSEFWHHIPKSRTTEPDLVVPLSSLTNNGAVEIAKKDHDNNQDHSVHKDYIISKTFRRSSKYMILLVSMVAMSALLIPFSLDRKKSELDTAITDIFYRKYSIASINTKFRELYSLTTKYQNRSRGAKQLNCIALNRIVNNKAYRDNVALFSMNTNETASKNLIIRLDPHKLETGRVLCQEEMKNLSFAAKQFFEFLRY
jgi:hypothetical protein